MQAILTKYLCPTDHRGSRVKASCQAKTIILSWDHSLNIEENHAAAALQLAESLKWLPHHYLESGCLPDGSYCHVIVSNWAVEACHAAVNWAEERPKASCNSAGFPFPFVKLARKVTGRE